VSNDFRQAYSDIPWKEMAGMRDKLIHDYLGVDIDVIWQTIEQDLHVINNLLKNI
jgi:uncharacterized protein with HEPN domain